MLSIRTPRHVSLSYAGCQPAACSVAEETTQGYTAYAISVAGEGSMPTRCSRCAVPSATLSLSSTRRIPLTTSTSLWVIQPGEATVTTGPSPSSTVVTKAVARSSTWQNCHVEDLATALV